MSRVIIKNLPKSITEPKLRSIFGEKGLITDIQLKYTPDGKFRRFAFIGYQSENEADEAIKHFHKTRINTSQITVEKCALLGDQTKPKSWSKYAPDGPLKKPEKKEKTKLESKKSSKTKENANKKLIEQYKDDPLFEEFLNVHKSKEAQTLLKSAENEAEDEGVEIEDTTKSENEEDNEAEEENAENEKIADKNISDKEYLKMLSTKKPRQRMEKKVKERIKLYTVKLRNVPYACKKSQLKQFFKPLKPYTIRLSKEVKGIAYVGFKDEKQYHKALSKDKSILSGKQISVSRYEKQTSLPAQENLMQNKWRTQEESLKNEEDIAESGRIFVRNLSYTTTDDDIQKLFEKYGPISDLSLPVDMTTRKMKGFGVITFLLPEHAVKAYGELDGSILHGRMLHLLPGKPKDDPDDDDEKSSNFKKKKAKKIKSQAGSSHNWNSLFLGHDAVADVVANTYNTTKEKVLDPHGSGSAAVRLALGETQIVATTKKYLEEQGVHLDAFNGIPVNRSKTVILVKNLPANTTSKEISDLFKVHGEIGRLIFPPSGITALVEFVEPSEAKKAFTKLAYTKFKSLPLYLEWAPDNSFITKDKKITSESEVKQVDETKENDKEEEEVEEVEEPEENTTIFVKNLNFKTTDESLRKHFEGCGKICYATVATKKDKSNPNNKLSMGYGFIQFMYKASADKALKTLQQSILEEKSLELKRSERTLANEVKTVRKVTKIGKQTGTKILVRNIPFQANKNEIMELFQTFGEIKALRLPKKMTVGSNSHRGFAFVDYTTNSDAKKAFEALSKSTHLYGRRLVLEWASNEESVEEIRKRTADHFHTDEAAKSKKSVFDMENA